MSRSETRLDNKRSYLNSLKVLARMRFQEKKCYNNLNPGTVINSEYFCFPAVSKLENAFSDT